MILAELFVWTEYVIFPPNLDRIICLKRIIDYSNKSNLSFQEFWFLGQNFPFYPIPSEKWEISVCWKHYAYGRTLKYKLELE